MRIGDILQLSAFVAAIGTPLAAATFDDPDWPCIQRKVEALSPGLMWPAPLPEDYSPDPDTAATADELVDRLVLRRIDVEEVRPMVAEFAEAERPDLDLMGYVFGEVFDRLSADRRQIMAGIADYSQKQIGLSRRIEDARQQMTAEMAREAPDFDRVDAIEEQIAWDERIYIDRQRSLTYVCETPVLLEKRLYAIAQMLQQAAAD